MMNIKDFILANVEKHPTDLVAITMRRFKVTRPAVHRHIEGLIKDGKLKKEGRRRAVKYSLACEKIWRFKVTTNLEEDKIWEETAKPLAKKLPDNVFRILQYGATEMINNVIDHSNAKELTVSYENRGNKIEMCIGDDGVGIFHKIAKAQNLKDMREAVLNLSKGKFTTAPEKHSGEGIFFTSRVFDRFLIFSDHLTYVRLNREQDWFVETRMDQTVKGTCIYMEIEKHSKRDLSAVFAEYQNPESHTFDKTNLFVKLAKLEEEQYVSRSQAKRLVSGLEKFKKIVLDFADVKSVGQAFVDELFRVYKNDHPEVVIEYVNANSDVEFMIKRGLATGG